MKLALKEILARPMEHFLLTTVLMLLIAASLGMIGLYRGIVVDATAVINLAKPDLWIVERDTIGPFAEHSVLDPEIADGLSGVPGVERARRYFHVIRELRINGERKRISIIGVDVRSDDGSWLPVTKGRAPADPGDIAANVTLGLSIGQSLSIGGDDYQVVGILENFVDTEGDPILVANLATARELGKPVPPAVARQRGKGIERDLEMSPFGRQLTDTSEQSEVVSKTIRGKPNIPISAIMVDVASGHNAQQVANAIKQRQDVSVMTQHEEIDSIVNHRMYKLRIQIMIFCIFIISITGVISGMIVYARVVENKEIVALLQYLGAQPSEIATYVISTALILVGAGYAGATLMAGILFQTFPRQAVLLPSDRLIVGLAVVAICMVSSVFAIRRALHTSPREVL
jgi:putative ABC transport system permease protein